MRRHVAALRDSERKVKLLQTIFASILNRRKASGQRPLRTLRAEARPGGKKNQIVRQRFLKASAEKVAAETFEFSGAQPKARIQVHFIINNPFTQWQNLM